VLAGDAHPDAIRGVALHAGRAPIGLQNAVDELSHGRERRAAAL
jgi:hypothetical protein